MTNDHAPLASKPAMPREQARSLLTDKTREIYDLLRQLRNTTGLSLEQAAEKFGIAAVVIGSYERGDRHPTVDKLNRLLGCYGYEIAAVPLGAVIVPPTGPGTPPRVWTEQDVADTLRSISGHFDLLLGLGGHA